MIQVKLTIDIEEIGPAISAIDVEHLVKHLVNTAEYAVPRLTEGSNDRNHMVRSSIDWNAQTS